MKSKIVIYIIYLSLVCFSACRAKLTENTEKPLIAVTILPQKYIVEKIAGNTVRTEVMILPGTSHETYDPTPSQLQNLSNASAYFRIGYLGFEQTWLDKIKEMNPSMKVFNFSDSISLIYSKHAHGHGTSNCDPHTWVSLNNLEIMAANCCSALKELFPADSNLFITNYQLFVNHLRKRDEKIASLLDTLPCREFIIYHPALAYFARDYNLIQHEMELEGKLPSPMHLKEIINAAREKNIKLLMIQKEFDVENAQQIAKEINATVVQINPLNENIVNEIDSLATIIYLYLSK